MFEGYVTLHVFDDHDGVIHNQTSGQNDAEHGQRVDGEAKHLDEGERAHQRNGDGNGGDDRRTPIEKEEEDDRDDDHNRFFQGRNHFLDGIADDGSGVKSDDILHARREGLCQFREGRFGCLIYIECIGVGKLLHTNTPGLMPAVLPICVVGFIAELCMAHIHQLYQAIGRALQNDLFEFLWSGEAPHNAKRNLEILRRRSRRAPELAGRNFDVLLLDRIDDIGGRQSAGRQPGRIEPDAHGIFALAKNDDIAHALDALERVFDIDIEIVRDVLVRQASVGRIEPYSKDEVRIRLRDCDTGVLDFLRQTALCRVYAVLHVNGSDVEVIPGVESDVDVAGAVV